MSLKNKLDIKGSIQSGASALQADRAFIAKVQRLGER